ncbi:MAG: 5'/3'-nucleotidase SurE [Candidatus Cloacimonadaceae bacterium]|nr:5'/3'-nucleotidase SurE [Candidatus Cloacimonadota bacterium]MDY0126792.1 5'/3'-nucleotidase SurE [Candidatus Cloacimonadaceae bacterium]MCB5254226.1 5'/3'-nucleotidase SurE [Candidatus Cloacimonadota bacterium]MCK9177507.1 5'/3'-nucleotidase SurE [Candidatus Cloacimonadota bacterium]MCK9243563.1 5'/3'-nucleotidase SurE [Candidatus Cloacimonadota bacterium]
MRILLVNDDGINAAGIRSLQIALKQAGHQIIMVAPDRERSAASHSITLRKDIHATRIGVDEWAVSGTPVDCVVIALQKIITEKIDLVISGINAGQNMGEDVLYSGTVAGAVEAAMLGHKAIALSVNAYQDQNFASATSWFMRLMQEGIADMVKTNEVWNINFPNLTFEDIKGAKLTRTGHRRYYNFVTIIEETADSFSYRVGGNAPEWDFESGTDSEAVNEGYISITPLGFELTKPDAFPRIERWLENRNLMDPGLNNAL